MCDADRAGTGMALRGTYLAVCIRRPYLVGAIIVSCVIKSKHCAPSHSSELSAHVRDKGRVLCKRICSIERLERHRREVAPSVSFSG
jgi:hypothetical protein